MSFSASLSPNPTSPINLYSPSLTTNIISSKPQYGILTFRSASLDDARHIAFSRQFGPLDDITPYLSLGRLNRFAPHVELFDVSNLNDDGSIAEPGTRRAFLGRGNSLFHVDSSFNPRRAGFSCLRAAKLPPRGTGGETEFADSRTAFDDLDPEIKEKLLREDYVAAHSLWHSRKRAAPDYEEFKTIEPRDFPFGRHRLVQRHERSGRMNLYIAAHVHHLERWTTDPVTGKEVFVKEVPEAEGRALIDELQRHATRPENVLRVEWEADGDLVVWDNTCVMHRAVPGGGFEGKFVRDMRRTTVHDTSASAWGLNERTGKRMGLP